MTIGEPVRIETERLVLDAHTQADFEPLAAMWADREVVRHIGGEPSSRTESWGRLLRQRGLWPVLGYGTWAVRDKSTGRYLGDLGFADYHRGIVPCIEGVPEAGWVLAREAQGRGYASEALAASLAWLDQATPHRRSVCLIDPDNARSRHLAARHGYQPFATTLYKNETVILLERFRPG